MPLEDYYALVGLAEMVAREERYDQEAQTLLASRSATAATSRLVGRSP